MLRSVREERARHFKLALRITVPVLIFVLLLTYVFFFREEPFKIGTESILVFSGMVFVVVYFVFFALELSRKETLLDRTTESYHYDAFLERIYRYRPKTLAAIQIKNLNVINENFGVRRTDNILKRFVEVLDDAIVEQNIKDGYIGRKNGGEFLLALNDEPETVRKELERFCRTHTEIDGIEIDCAFAVIRNNIDDPDKAVEQLRDLLAQRESFDRALQTAKISDARSLSEEEQAVVDALERKDLEFHFRPLQNLKTGKKDIYEVAVKMRDASGNPIAPRDFLPIINRRDLGDVYDLLILERVLEDALLLDEELSLSFNLSPFSLRKEHFMEEFFQRIENSRITPRRLIVELYERQRHHRLEEYLERLKRIKRSGVRLCLDNFGSSNASMEYLRHFPFDMIRFDREYTFDVEAGKNLSILKSFINMAQEMGITTVAKWVDKKEKIHQLEELGVDYIQGFATGRVLKEEELIERYNPLRDNKES
ncbi:EAL domain-containing protein [Nitratifractor salsuginis]|uniref:Diguanylate phosphodiesterase n=1 Tax=Nitratifractor salsuginis (strain DSM 16511 / JCM 12458 / E9I37-1) TaxID=749222 RepID=E6X2U1_NITSE|nr:EAL domain-containing protein [Nitratifractor salsuginis]ADV47224.1 diguanylate phosphodiesterase [Nitratifractor salsuginis DSM 16511]